MTETTEAIANDESITKSSKSDYYEKLTLAMVTFNKREYPQTLEICEDILKVWPGGAETYMVLGVVAYVLDNQGRAITLIEQAHKLDPECRDYAEALANLYTRVGKLNEGLYFAKLANTLRPHPSGGNLVPAGLSNYFEALGTLVPPKHFLEASRNFNQRNYDATIEKCQSQLDIDRNHVDCWRLFGQALHCKGDYEDAVGAFHAAIHMDPGHAMDRVFLGHSLYKLGRFSEALSCHESARRMAPEDIEVHMSTIGGLKYQANEIWPLHRKWNSSWARSHVVSRKKKPMPEFQTAPGNMIRIGYITDRPFQCPELMFLEPLFKYRNKHIFEIYCYHNNTRKDVVTTRFENYVDRWRDVSSYDETTLGYILEGDAIDILVDLTFDAEGTSAGLVSKRAAGVVVSWSGNPEATATPGVDYILSDKTTENIDSKAALKDQQSIALDMGLFGIDPLVFYPDVNALPARSNGHVTFGGICDLARISPATASVWASILLSVQGSRLALGYVDHISAGVKESVIDLFGHFGVADRIHIQGAPKAGVTPESEEDDKKETQTMNKAFFGLIDIFLDTFPVSGTVETCESLWMGVPVISLTGKRRHGLMSASILRSAGQDHWVASSHDDYIEKASALADNLDDLETIRETLRGDVEKSTLLNPSAFVRSIENAYISILRK